MGFKDRIAGKIAHEFRQVVREAKPTPASTLAYFEEFAALVAGYEDLIARWRDADDSDERARLGTALLTMRNDVDRACRTKTTWGAKDAELRTHREHERRWKSADLAFTREYRLYHAARRGPDAYAAALQQLKLQAANLRHTDRSGMKTCRFCGGTGKNPPSSDPNFYLNEVSYDAYGIMHTKDRSTEPQPGGVCRGCQGTGRQHINAFDRSCSRCGAAVGEICAPGCPEGFDP